MPLPEKTLFDTREKPESAAPVKFETRAKKAEAAPVLDTAEAATPSPLSTTGCDAVPFVRKEPPCTVIEADAAVKRTVTPASMTREPTGCIVRSPVTYITEPVVHLSAPKTDCAATAVIATQEPATLTAWPTAQSQLGAEMPPAHAHEPSAALRASVALLPTKVAAHNHV
jgi:hypothetical protein